MANPHAGKFCAPFRGTFTESLRWCVCGHGKNAHRDGRGDCIGERYVPASDSYVDCGCHAYVERERIGQRAP